MLRALLFCSLIELHWLHTHTFTHIQRKWIQTFANYRWKWKRSTYITSCIIFLFHQHIVDTMLHAIQNNSINSKQTNAKNYIPLTHTHKESEMHTFLAASIHVLACSPNIRISTWNGIHVYMHVLCTSMRSKQWRKMFSTIKREQNDNNSSVNYR